MQRISLETLVEYWIVWGAIFGDRKNMEKYGKISSPKFLVL
jgi:hypothetical protein